MPDNLDETYREIAETILSTEGQCALILGPELSVDEQNMGYRSHFRKIARDAANGITNYFENDNLFAFADDTALKRSRRLVKDFYRRSGDAVLLELIARIRFPLIINLCPDTALNEVFTKNNYDFRPGYFAQARDVRFKDLPYPTKTKPVIYNIFGIADVDTTLILNHSKLYEMIQHLLSENSLPEQLETFLDRASAFLLLGVRFETWYYQLICHKLKLREFHTIKTNLSATGINDDHDAGGSGSVSLVVRKHFGIDFSPDNPTQAVERLINACAGNHEALRDPKTPSVYGLYVSYAWKDRDDPADITRETPVDWAQRHSKLYGVPSIQFCRDRDEVSFGDSIDSFMTRIGKGKAVIRVISDEYLRSKYSMLESIRISQYNDDEQRVFNILWHDVDLNNEIVYRDFWKEECSRILEDIEKKLDNSSYDDSVRIYRFIIGFFNRLRDKIGLESVSGDFIIDQKDKGIGIIESRKKVYEEFIDKVIEKTCL